MADKIEKTDDEWRQQLSDDEYNNRDYPSLGTGMVVAKVNIYNLHFGPDEDNYYALADPVEVMRRASS